MAETYPVVLTRGAAGVLSDALRNDAPRSPDGATPAPYLLLKIGAALIPLMDEKRYPPLDEAVVLLTEQELWMLRDTVHLTWMVGSEPVGKNLVLQIYWGLQALAAPEVIASLGVLVEGKNQEMGRKETVKALAGKKEDGGGYDARDDESDEDAHKDPLDQS